MPTPTLLEQKMWRKQLDKSLKKGKRDSRFTPESNLPRAVHGGKA